jgi:UDP-N-acetylmuramyl pentapeptide phosphotransferase/UDP-N-acetylglucosamine-1-phosphate transferase
MKMTEGKALAFVFMGITIAFLGGAAVLASIDAANEAYALLALVVGVIALQAVEAIIHRYSARRRKR